VGRFIPCIPLAVVLLGACEAVGLPEMGVIRGYAALCVRNLITNEFSCHSTVGEDPPGVPITVTASGPEDRTVLVTKSQSNPFILADLPAGMYRLTATYPDFSSSPGRVCKVRWDTQEVEVMPNDTINVVLPGWMNCAEGARQ